MSDIFLSYASDDRPRVSEIADALKKLGWSVWWDRNTRSGHAYPRIIETALDAARCVLVVWSHKSVNSDWVRAEAANGLSRDILVAVDIDNNVKRPLQFSQIQSEDFTDWNGDISSPEFQKLVSDVTTVLDPGSCTAQFITEPTPPRSELGVPNSKIEVSGKVFNVGDRVRIKSRAGEMKPEETNHPKPVHSGPGQTGTIVEFQKKGIPSYLRQHIESGSIPLIHDPDEIEVALVRWSPQKWSECKTGESVTIGAFASRINVIYLELL
jgi:hypothetical protein